MNPKSFFAINIIISILILIMSTNSIHPKGTGACAFTGVVFQNNYNEICVSNVWVSTGVFVIEGLELSWKDLVYGFYPYVKFYHKFPVKDEARNVAASYQILIMNGGIGKSCKIENAFVDITLSAGNKWEKYNIEYLKDRISLSNNVIIWSVGTRIRSPFYKRIYTFIGYDYLSGRDQHWSGTFANDINYEVKSYGKLNLWTIGLEMEF
ncbi:hypothetical protein ES703_02588 [subsurface metagenome]